MAVLDTIEDFQAVRAAIDVSLTARIVPDSVIRQDQFQGEAERLVLARAGRPAATAEERAAVRLACVYLTAARLLPSIPRVTSERFADQSYTREALSVDERVQQLERWAAEQIDVLIGPATPPPATHRVRPIVFTVAKGRRGQ